MATATQESQFNPNMLYERGLDYMKAGDFAAARKDFNQLLAQKPNHDLEQKTLMMLKRLRVDWVEIAAGLAVLALLISLFSYFGLKH